jgi:hypothetical protein
MVFYEQYTHIIEHVQLKSIPILSHHKVDYKDK